MQSAIMSILQNSTIMSLCKAMGIIYTAITKPYFNIASSNISALQMGPYYLELIQNLKKIHSDPSILFSSDFKIFSNLTDTDKDKSIFEQTTDTDHSFVLETISLMCKSLFEKCEKLFSDFLPGGKLHSQTHSSCPSNNISLERLMAQIDREKRIAPNMTTSTLNSKLLFKNNKTSVWLENKSEEEKSNTISLAKENLEKVKEKENSKFIKLNNDKTTIIECKKRDILK